MKKLISIIFLFQILIQISNSQTLNLSVRNPNSYNGTQIISLLTPLSLSAREDTIFNQIIKGNVPDFLRNLIPVSDTINVSGTNKIITYYVTPDYMALGCDTDYFLCPMTPLLAQRIANYIGYSLPTRKMVNDIWQRATVKLTPQPIAPSPQMTTVSVFAKHDSMVWVSRSAQIPSHPLGELVGGDKKDVIISNSIYGNPAPGRVVIYGWHQLNGSPIQPLYYGHEETYADYSHGIRLVQNEVLIDGCLNTIQNILQSATFNTLLSDEGIINIPRYPVTPINISKPSSFCILVESPGTINIKSKYNSSIKGYNVALSYDGKCFDAHTYYNSNDFNIYGLIPDSIIYIKISAVGISGGTSDYSEVLGAYTISSTPRNYIIVNGFDRATTGNTFDFIIQHGNALKSNNAGFSSCTNEAITDSLILLSEFDAADYILGEESTANETFSSEEQLIISDYLNNGGRLFVSGSEIGWDLDHLGSATDKVFFNNYLLSEYVEDSPNNQPSTYYNATFTAPLSTNIHFTFDNGTHGTYDVRYPDVINSISSGGWNGTPLEYFDAFPYKIAGTYDINRLVYMTIPFETIYPQNNRNLIMNLVFGILFYEINTNETNFENTFEMYPNPVNDFLQVSISNTNSDNIELSISSISGNIIYKNINIKNKNAISINTESFAPGIYFIQYRNKGSVYTKKFTIVR